MTTLREAAQQALEFIKVTNARSEFWFVPESNLNKTVKALRAALEQPEQDEAPAAWMFQHEETGRMNYVSNDGYDATGRFLEMNPRYALVCALYTYPPLRREWRGLTEEEIKRIDDSTHFHESPDWSLRFARAVERAHGIGEKE
jgi:hypothetical protein